MRPLTFLFCLTLSFNLLAQNYDFGKVSKEELEEKFNPLDSSASATYLYKQRKTYIQYSQTFGFQLITEIQERVKIYNQEGFDYATVEKYLYKSGSDKEELNGLRGNTYNLVNGKIEDTKLQKDGIFNSEYNKYNNLSKFTMPNIKEGSVIEYKYTIVSPFVTKVDDFVFQHAIPVKKIDAYFETPEYFSYKINTKGYYPVTPIHEAKSGRITTTTKERGVIPNKNGFTSYSSSSLDYISNKTIYDLSNVPALKEEPFVNNIDNYRSAISYELSYTKFPQAAVKNYATTWEDVVRTIYESSSFGDELNKTGYFEDDVDAILSSVSDPLMRVSSIFNLVKSKVKWNGYYGKFCDDGVRKAYKDQVGNVAEINIMLTSMLRYAGLNANPVLVSTRQNGIPLFPTIDGYNYVISCVETDQGIILMDATNRYSTPNMLPIRALNWEGRIVRKDKSSTTIGLYPNAKSQETVLAMMNLNESGKLEGQLRSTATVYEAMAFRENYMETDKDQFLENLENKYNGMEISEFDVKDVEDLSKPVIESYKFTLENQADVINGKIYFSPLFFLKQSENPFKLDNREFPVDFGYSRASSYRLIINLPEGYQVESLPEQIVYQLPDNLGTYSYIIDNTQKNVIQISISNEINTPIVSPVHYEAIKAYFSGLVDKESEQIVLTKV